MTKRPNRVPLEVQILEQHEDELQRLARMENKSTDQLVSDIIGDYVRDNPPAPPGGEAEKEPL